LSQARPARWRSTVSASSRLSFVVEQVGVGQRAGRDDARHRTLHRPLGQRRVADLLADRHRNAELDQLGQVAVDGVVGNAGHGDRLAGRLAARGQRDVEQARGLLGIVEEQLVEIPMRKNSSLSACSALARSHCCITGVCAASSAAVNAADIGLGSGP
jgi:hypothetical protein